MWTGQVLTSSHSFLYTHITVQLFTADVGHHYERLLAEIFHCRSALETARTTDLLHCKENTIYVFQEKELRGLSLNLHIHVSVSDLYILWIGPHIFLQQNRQTNRGNIYLNRPQTHECGNWDWGRTIPFLGIFV
jgi:hypothetical protein